MALQTALANPWPARLCLAASSLSFIVCPCNLPVIMHLLIGSALRITPELNHTKPLHHTLTDELLWLWYAWRDDETTNWFGLELNNFDSAWTSGERLGVDYVKRMKRRCRCYFHYSKFITGAEGLLESYCTPLFFNENKCKCFQISIVDTENRKWMNPLDRPNRLINRK